jgi:beta-phosphoglucomutase-like phosphatase (HAD superfamily)
MIAFAHGRRAAEIIATVARHLSVADQVALLSQRAATDARGINAIPGATALVARLPASRWAVVASGTRAVATFRLGIGGIRIPAVLVDAADVSRGKSQILKGIYGGPICSASIRRTVWFSKTRRRVWRRRAARACGV